MKKKQKNKGFSLVELIVVIAIMGVLAVTLAPRLGAYVEKARKASDREIINSIYTAVQVGLADEAIAKELDTLSDGISSGTGTASINLHDGTTATSSLYDIIGSSTWSPNNDATGTYDKKDNKFVKELWQVLGDFKFKSKDATTSTQITIEVKLENYIATSVKVTLDYDGTATGVDTYEVPN